MPKSSSGNFPRIFVIFGVLFVPLNNFYVFSGIVFALKIISKKKENLSYLSGPSPKARPISPSGPAAARLSPSGPRPPPWPVSMADTAGSPGHRCPLVWRPAPPHKRAAAPARAPASRLPCSAAARCRLRCARPKPAPPRRTRPPAPPPIPAGPVVLRPR
jgi:hypothetical protein